MAKEKNELTKGFLKDRREALTKVVMRDDWKSVRKYCKKYGVEMPKDSRTFKAGVYKAVQGCTDIPQNVKEIARSKCLALGFKPYINPYEVGNE